MIRWLLLLLASVVAGGFVMTIVRNVGANEWVARGAGGIATGLVALACYSGFVKGRV